MADMLTRRRSAKHDATLTGFPQRCPAASFKFMNSLLRILVSTATLTMANELLVLRGAEIETTVVDALGAPLAGASVELRLTRKGSDGKITNVVYLTLTTDQAGRAKGTYDEKVCALDGVRISLPGYNGYSTGLRAKYELKKQFTARDVRRAARLKGERQRAELRPLLVGDYEPTGGAYERLDDLFFVHYQDLRLSLLDLLPDPQVGPRAAERLRLIGNPDDLTIVAKQTPQVASSAIEQINLAPQPRPNTNLVEVAATVARTLERDAGRWTGNKEPRLNDDETMALVDCESFLTAVGSPTRPPSTMLVASGLSEVCVRFLKHSWLFLPSAAISLVFGTVSGVAN